MPIAKRAADEVSAIFPKPIKLEFEKIYYPFLLMNKKRYAGLLWTSTEKYDKLDAKGLETVRRDNCLLVRTLVDTCLRKVRSICCCCGCCGDGGCGGGVAMYMLKSFLYFHHY